RAGVDQDLAQLLRDPLGADDRDLWGHLADRRGRRRLDRESESGRESNRPDQAQLVLPEAGPRVADSPKNLGPQVRLSADVIDDAAVERVEEHAVDGEIPAGRGLLGGREDDRLPPGGRRRTP